MIIVIIISAVLIDILFGDPPNRFHPVAWSGKLISSLWEKRPAGRKVQLFLYGVFLTLVTVFAASAAASLVRFVPFLAGGILTVILFKMSFSVHDLFRAASGISGLLAAEQLDAARVQTSTHLVSRPTAELSPGQLSAAVIGSVSENLTDSFTSPVFFYVLAGLPGAWAFRAVNTCDAMIGYRRGDHEWGGKFAARLDDVLNFIPARLTVFTIIICGFFTGRLRRDGLGRIRASAALTDSPNAGLTMAAMAVVLGIRLEKIGHYVLNAEGREPSPADIRSALRYSAFSLLILTALLIGFGVLIHGL